MTNSHKMIRRSQVKQYNSIDDSSSELHTLLKNLSTESCIPLKIYYLHRIYEIQNNNFNVFIELDNENRKFIQLFDTIYHKSLWLIPLLREIQERKYGTEFPSLAIQEIEKYQIKFKTYVMSYLNNSLLSKINDDVIGIIYTYLY